MVLLVTSCHEEPTASVSTSQILGTWKSSDKEEITFREDRTFIVADMKWKGLIWAESCPRESAQGTWGFWVDDGDSSSIVSEEADTGRAINLSFPQAPECHLDMSVIEKGRTLCPSDGLDEVCTSDTRFKHAEPENP